MATKVIKLQDNNNILIPVTDASVVQMSVEGQVKSVKDVIIENEEVTAAGYNDLNSRVIALEESPGIDKVGTITDVRVNSSTVVSNGIANISKATNDKLGVIKLGYTDANKGYALKVDSNGKGYVNVPWTDTKTTESGHYTPTGTATNATYVNGNLTKSTGSVPLTHGTSLVITGVKYNKDAKGHVTDISYSLGKLPSDSDTRVAFTATSDSNKYPLIFKSSTGPTTTPNTVRFDSNGTYSAYYVASTHSAFIHTTYHAASYLAGNEMVGFKTVNSNMNALSLFSSTGASSTLGVMFRDRYNNAILPVTSSDMIEVNYGGTSKILTSLLQENEQVTTEALIDLYNRINNYSADFATISYQASSLSSGGVVSGVVKNNLNRTSGNITTIRTVGEVEQPNGGTGTARTILRYETPLINIAKGVPEYNLLNGLTRSVKSSFPVPNSTTVNKNYYDPIKNNTNKANIYGTGASNIAYAPMVDGNNYCDVSNSTYEMYFFNTNKLRNYLTAYARIDFNKPYLKEINEDTVFQWGPYDNGDKIQETLTLKKDEISFNKEWTEWEDPDGPTMIFKPDNRTVIKPQSIQTNTFKVINPIGSNDTSPARVEISNSSINVFTDSQKVSIAGDQSTFNHTAYAVKFMETSDERLKTNISPIAYDPDGIGIYSFVKNNYDSYSYGFIAQNIAETHPELVSENTVTSYLAVDYDATLALLLAKALNRIDALEKRVLELEKAEINDHNLI